MSPRLPRAAPRLRPRWHKVLTDIWGSKVRSALVVASVGIGLFAVGMIATMHAILSNDMRAGYALINPANIVIFTSDFDDEMVDAVARVEGVERAEGLRAFDLMVRTSGAEEWVRLGVEASDDFSERKINLLSLESGHWPPQKRQVALERNKVEDVLLQDGAIEIKLPDGAIRRAALTGVVHDLTLGAGEAGGFFLAPVQAYITRDTLPWLGEPESYNKMLVRVATSRPGQSEDETYLREVANRVSECIEENGGIVYNAQVRGSRDHPNAAYVDAITGVLFLLGALVVFLSSFLITNTLSALLKQQAQQIAIMKTIGARSFQVMGMYMTLIFLFAALALSLSLPLSRQAAYRLLDFLSVRINFDILSYRGVPAAVLLQVVIALVVPQAAGLAPILRGARVKVQDALNGTSAPAPARPARARPASANRLAALRRLAIWRRRIARPLLISLRNTFRQKGRLGLTLTTLTLGGAIFIATFNVQVSLENYIERVGHYFMADVNLTLDADYRIERIQEVLRGVPGVQSAEGWAYGRSELLMEDDQAGDAVQLLGPPANSRLIEPILLRGRWVRADDRGAIVLSERFLSRYPDLQVGDTLRLRVNGEKTSWVVVGFFQLVGKSAGFVAYTSYEDLSRIVGQYQRAITYRVTAARPHGRALTQEEQAALGARMEAALQKQGFGVVEVSAGASLVTDTAEPLNTLTTFLMIMAVLIAIVGSIGLMGTMSMNVLDRTREIGVMRAVGASDRVVMRLVMVEGVLIGMISWVLGTLLAIPISKLLSDTIHMAIFDARAEFAFTAAGPLYWLALVLALSLLASALPARSAARMTIREALAYE